MLDFVQNYGAPVCAIIAAILSIVAMMIRSKGGSTGVFDAVKWALKALPGLITFSETVNNGADGATKKAFVLEQITNNFAIMGVVIDDVTLAEISETIDKIVDATKRVNVKGGANNAGNSGHDIGTVTGLRAGT